jgi:hypothetical protein
MNPDIVTTITAKANSYDLVALSNLTDDLGIVDNTINRFLKRAITSQSQAVQKYCNNAFVIEGISNLLYDSQRHRFGGISRTRSELLQLTRWPLLAVNSVTETLDGTTTDTLVAGTDFVIDYANGQLLRLDSDTNAPKPWRALWVSVAYAAGHGTSVAEAHTVPATPYQVKVTNWPTFGVDLGVTYATGAALTAVATPTAAGQYSINQATGTYTFSVADSGASIIASYCYNQIPLDIQDAVTRLVLAKYEERGKDRWLKREVDQGQGEKEWWFPSGPGGNLTPDIREILDAYRVPTIG